MVVKARMGAVGTEGGAFPPVLRLIVVFLFAVVHAVFLDHLRKARNHSHAVKSSYRKWLSEK
jgi:hypothetical protein